MQTHGFSLSYYSPPPCGPRRKQALSTEGNAPVGSSTSSFSGLSAMIVLHPIFVKRWSGACQHSCWYHGHLPSWKYYRLHDWEAYLVDPLSNHNLVHFAEPCSGFLTRGEGTSGKGQRWEASGSGQGLQNPGEQDQRAGQPWAWDGPYCPAAEMFLLQSPSLLASFLCCPWLSVPPGYILAQDLVLYELKT